MVPYCDLSKIYIVNLTAPSLASAVWGLCGLKEKRLQRFGFLYFAVWAGVGLKVFMGYPKLLAPISPTEYSKPKPCCW